MRVQSGDPTAVSAVSDSPNNKILHSFLNFLLSSSICLSMFVLLSFASFSSVDEKQLPILATCLKLFRGITRRVQVINVLTGSDHDADALGMQLESACFVCRDREMKGYAGYNLSRGQYRDRSEGGSVLLTIYDSPRPPDGC